MGSTPVIMISIRMIRKLRNILQVQGCSWWLLCIIDPMCHIFLETLGKIQYIGDDFRYHGRHQDDQEAQEHPPSTRVFLMAPLHYLPYVSYISGNLGQNPVHWWWLCDKMFGVKFCFGLVISPPAGTYAACAIFKKYLPKLSELSKNLNVWWGKIFQWVSKWVSENMNMRC